MSGLFLQKFIKAVQFFQSGDLDRADRHAEESLQLNSRFSEALHLRGVIAGLTNRHADAENFLRRAAEYDRKNPSITFNLAKSLSEQGKDAEAIKWHKRAAQLDPDNDKVWINFGKSLFRQSDLDNAIFAFDRAIQIFQGSAVAFTNKGACLCERKVYIDALALHEHAISLDSNLVEAWTNRGIVLDALKRYGEALASYKQAQQLDPGLEFILGDIIQTEMKICDWREIDARRDIITSKILQSERVARPFVILGLLDSPQLQKAAAEIYAEENFKPVSRPDLNHRGAKKQRIRIGYFSMDFREHPVSRLIAELFELHDRETFEIYGFSFGINTGDPMRQRLEKAFDKFFDVKHLSDSGIAHLSRQLDIDIAIDLAGFTQDSRPLIFAERAAPIQINYLGYPGTLGIEQIDYLIADQELIPTGSEGGYSEKIIYLPNCYQVNDSKRKISDRIFTRKDVNLPESGFVFCCFNNSWKIVPEVFDIWLRILRAVKGSTLWLYEDNAEASTNLRQEALSRGVDPHRLVFAKHMAHDEHLARYRLADLFLDTLPYNAHTTASDALWAGTPVLTLQGESFASRVAASLLKSIGAPELVARNAEEYETLAIELATDPGKLAFIRKKLADIRSTAPLFDTQLFAKHIESAYEAIYDRYHSGLHPDHIYVSP